MEAGGYGGDYSFSKIPDTDKLKSKIKKFLEPHGLWNEKIEKSFGIHLLSTIC